MFYALYGFFLIAIKGSIDVMFHIRSGRYTSNSVCVCISCKNNSYYEVPEFKKKIFKGIVPSKRKNLS